MSWRSLFISDQSIPSYGSFDETKEPDNNGPDIQLEIASANPDFGYADVYLWYPNKDRPTGHVSMQLYNNTKIPYEDGGYISITPSDHGFDRSNSSQAIYNHNLAHDCNNEQGLPDEIFRVNNLNVVRIKDEFHRIRASTTKWNILGSCFFKCRQDITNCAALILELLVKYGDLKSYITPIPMYVMSDDDDGKIVTDIITLAALDKSLMSSASRCNSMLMPIIQLLISVFLAYAVTESLIPQASDIAKIFMMMAVIIVNPLAQAAFATSGGIVDAFSDCCKIVKNSIISPSDVGFVLHYLAEKRASAAIVIKQIEELIEEPANFEPEEKHEDLQLALGVTHHNHRIRS